MDNVYILIYVRRDPSEAPDVAFTPCTHCKSGASAMDGLKMRLGLKNLKDSTDDKQAKAKERKEAAKIVKQLFPQHSEIFSGLPLTLPNGEGYILAPVLGPNEKNVA